MLSANNKRGKRVIITGASRSGTSMVTGLLQKCGLHIGNTLKPQNHHNQKGYFEDIGFKNINRRILKHGGGGWYQAPESIESWDALHKPMQQFLNSWPQDKIVGWKCVRACLTLPVWKEFISLENLRVVFCRRDIDAIAQSMVRVNSEELKMSRVSNDPNLFNKASELARIFIERAYKNLQDVEFIETFYENYFENWREELGKVCDFLGLAIPENTREIESFIDRKLCHFGSLGRA